MTVDSSTYLSFKGTGVFSSTGADKNKSALSPSNKLYWLVETKDNGEMTIRHLDEVSWAPSGEARPITLRELQRDMYKPEPDLYRESVFPRLQAAAQLPVPDSVPPAAPLPLDEPLEDIFADDPVTAGLRNKFSQAVSMAEEGNIDQASSALTQILKDAALSEKKHRHLFNEFGINLRKNNLRSQSIDFYMRALELTGEEVDENLHFNLARALYDEERYLACTQHLFKALKVSPRNWAVLRFLAWMQEKGVIPKQYHLDVKGQLANGIPDMPSDLSHKSAAPTSVDAPEPAQPASHNEDSGIPDDLLPSSLPDFGDLMGS